MTFTSTTIRKLRALNLDQDTFDKVLEIFEEAKEAKPKKKGCAADREARGTRLPADWSLPMEYRDWATSIGLGSHEISRESTKFRNYWLNQTNGKGIKLRWDLTWQNWCLGMLERAGRQPRQPTVHMAVGAIEQDQYSDETWQAIARRFKTTGNWNPGWGPGPGEPGCRMPAKFNGRSASIDSEMGP